MNIKQVFKNDKVNNLLKYSSIKYIALIIGFVKGIVNARALGPELLGVAGNLLLILSYLGYTNFGILYSMNREYVIFGTNNDIKGAKKVISTSFTSLALLAIFLLITAVGTKFIYKGDLGTYIFLTFIIGILEQYRSFYINYFRLVNKFRKINYIELVNNVFSFVLLIISIGYFKIYSVLLSMLLADFIILIYGYKNSEKIRLSLDLPMLKNLIIIGLPLLVYNFGFYILTTVDRLMTIKFLGYKDLGYFTFSSQIVGGTLVFITSVLFLYYPKAIKNLNINSGNNMKEILNKTEQYTKYVEVLGVLLCVTGAVLIKPFVDRAVPQYVESINIYRILIFGTIANQIAYFSNVFIVSNKKQKYLIYLQLIVVIIAVILNYSFIKLGMGIIGVSLATLISNIIYSIMQHYIYLKILNTNKGKFINILKVYSKFILYILLCTILSFLNINFTLFIFSISVITALLYYKDLKRTIVDISKM